MFEKVHHVYSDTEPVTISRVRTDLGIAPETQIFISGEKVPDSHVVNPGDKLDLFINAPAGPFQGDITGGVIGRDQQRMFLTTLFQVGSIAVGSLVHPLAGAAVGLAGVVAATALVPPAIDTELERAGHQVEGIANRVDPYGPVPVIYGRTRVFPKLATFPWTEMYNSDQYLRTIFALGVGPLRVYEDTLKLGDRSIDNFDVTYEILTGVEGDQFNDTQFNNIVHEQSINLRVEYGEDPIQFTTADDTVEISFDVVFPNGLVNVVDLDFNVTEVPHQVDFEVEYRPHGFPEEARWNRITRLEDAAYDPEEEADEYGIEGVGDFLSNALDFLGDVETFLGFQDEEDTLLAFEANFLQGMVSTLSNRIDSALSLAQYVEEHQDTLFSMVESLNNVFNLLDNFGIAEEHNILNPETQLGLDNLMAGMPAFQALQEFSRDLELGDLQHPSQYPPFIQWMIVRNDLTHLVDAQMRLHEGEIQDATSNTVQFDQEASDRSRSYVNNVVVIDGEEYKILVYDGANRTATITPEFDTIPEAGTPFYIARPVVRLTGNSEGLVRRTVRWRVPKGKYDVRIRRLSEETDGEEQDNIQSESRVAVVRSFVKGEPINVEGISLIAMRAKATEDLAGRIDELNVEVESILPVWDEGNSEFKDEITSNPAWAFLDVLKNPKKNHRPVDDSQIDLDGIKEWAVELDNEEFTPEEGDILTGRTIGLEIREEMTTKRALHQIANIGRASYRIHGGKHSIIQDKPDKLPVTIFTPDDYWDFQWERPFVRMPHAISASFLNKESSYRRDEMLIFRDGYSKDGAGETKEAVDIESQEFTGFTEPLQVFKDARFEFAVAIARSEHFSFYVPHILVLQKGDVFQLVSETAMFALGSGRIEKVVRDGSDNITSIEIDSYVVLPDDTIFVTIRRNDGVLLTKEVLESDTETTTFTFETPFEDSEVEVDSLVGVGNPATMLCTEIRFESDNSCRIFATHYAPDVFTSDVDPLPEHDSQITAPPERQLPSPPVSQFVEGEEAAVPTSVVGPSRTKVAAMILNFEPPPSGHLKPEKRKVGVLDVESISSVEDVIEQVLTGQSNLDAVDVQRAINEMYDDKDSYDWYELDPERTRFTVTNLPFGKEHLFVTFFVGPDGQRGPGGELDRVMFWGGGKYSHLGRSRVKRTTVDSLKMRGIEIGLEEEFDDLLEQFIQHLEDFELRAPLGQANQTLRSVGAQGWTPTSTLETHDTPLEVHVNHTLVITPHHFTTFGEVSNLIGEPETCGWISGSADVVVDPVALYCQVIVRDISDPDNPVEVYSNDLGSFTGESGEIANVSFSTESLEENTSHEIEFITRDEENTILDSSTTSVTTAICCNDCESGVLKDTYYLYWPEWGVMKAEWITGCTWRWTEPDVEITPKTARLRWNSFQGRWMVDLVEPALIGSPKCEFGVYGVSTPCNPVGVYDDVAFCEGDCPSCTDPVTVTEEEPE